MLPVVLRNLCDDTERGFMSRKREELQQFCLRPKIRSVMKAEAMRDYIILSV